MRHASTTLLSFDFHKKAVEDVHAVRDIDPDDPVNISTLLADVFQIRRTRSYGVE